MSEVTALALIRGAAGCVPVGHKHRSKRAVTRQPPVTLASSHWGSQHQRRARRCAAHHVLYAICAVTLVVITGITGHGTIYGGKVWGVAGGLRGCGRGAGAAAASAGRGVWANVRLLTPSVQRAAYTRTRRWATTSTSWRPTMKAMLVEFWLLYWSKMVSRR